MKKDVALALIIFIVSAFLLFDKLTAAHPIQIIVEGEKADRIVRLRDGCVV
jgi:hypothetical protein